ncbi:uncharacterized protein TrAtP1_011246 [Trichoderma atroviride]|uniref:uncharacterized protein n=1 Tax=Hypocrea atroviridis TaxID=63577 RepID=UPI003322C346|nr:hypothetical protein TrAtP1_011246 [Trichoderma atroviride]
MHSIHAEKFDGYRPVGARLLWEAEVRYCCFVPADSLGLGAGTRYSRPLLLSWPNAGILSLSCISLALVFFFLFVPARRTIRQVLLRANPVWYHLPGPASGYFQRQPEIQ